MGMDGGGSPTVMFELPLVVDLLAQCPSLIARETVVTSSLGLYTSASPTIARPVAPTTHHSIGLVKFSPLKSKKPVRNRLRE